MSITAKTAIRHMNAVLDATCHPQVAKTIDPLTALQVTRNVLLGHRCYREHDVSQSEADRLFHAVEDLIMDHVGSKSFAVRNANEALRSLPDFLS